ncbi:MAG: c-type cytochrome [Thiotrichales bacterium]
MMKKIATVMTAAAFLVLAGAANASAELATKHKCNTCHAAEKKMVGPSWKEIAAANKETADAEQVLAHAIQKGVKGKYGKIPMPPQPNVPDEDAAAIAKWLMSQ